MKRYFSFPDHQKITLPNLSPTMETGGIQSWGLKEGDKVIAGAVLANIETDKANIDFEMQDEGYIAKLLFDEGTKDVPVGTPIAILVDDEDDIAAFKDYKPEDAPAAAPAESAPEPEAPAAASTPTASSAPAPARQASGDRVFASPLAHKLASEKGISVNDVQGTGPNGRVIAADVKEYKPAPAAGKKAATPATSSAGLPDFTDTEVSSIRKVIADRLTYSKSNIPHYYVTVSVEVDELLKLRARLN